MNLKLKIFLAFLTCTLITIGVIVFTLISFRNIGRMTDTLVHDVRINENANYFAKELARSRRLEKEFFIFPRNEKKQLKYVVAWKKSYTRIRDEFIPQIETRYQESNDTASLAKLAEVKKLMNENMVDFDKVVARFKKTKSYAAVNKAEYGTFKDRTHVIEDIADKLGRDAMRKVNIGWQKLTSMRQETGFILQIVFGVSVLWGVFLPVFFAGRLSRAITYLTKMANDISQGRMGEEIRMRRRDEVGKLAKALVRLQKSMRMVMDRYRRREG